MLKLKNIKKDYKTGDFVQHALKGVDLTFRENEFVAVLGPSGSGKTTLLNIIGGLDRYDSGDLIIDGKSTKKFKDKDWDAYRNHAIGFVFQSYNLIGHISVLENVEMGMTLSGVSSAERRKKALSLLEKVGLKEHAHKRPNQLSGGQMQRVAIARALANDPKIILADEPTGALDSKTSTQIMDLIKEISKDKLVIMVTHNAELAESYATRIVKMKDGELLSDSKPYDSDESKGNLNIKKTAMSFWTALKLSFGNIRTKKGRTILTAFASSIGIIGIALILSLSNGFNIEVENFEQDSLSQSPIIVTNQTVQMDEDTLNELRGDNSTVEYPSDKEVYAQKNIADTIIHSNKITSDYIDYLDKLNKDDISGISYVKGTSINIVSKNGDDYSFVQPSSSSMMSSTSSFEQLPSSNGDDGIIENNYDVLAGEVNEDEVGLVLFVNSRNQISSDILKQLGFDEHASFDDIINKELKVILNDDYYIKVGNNFMVQTDLEKLYDSEDSITVKITAILRGKEDKELIATNTGLYYTEALGKKVISSNDNSEIVKVQREADYNVLTRQSFDDTMTKDMILGYLGADVVPTAIYIYPKDFETKDEVTSYLDKYNEGKAEEDVIQYTDMAEMISTLSGNIMDAITIVLIAFSSISLVVSSIMIGIITYISVLERTKEIGILRAIGARKKDITRVFNAETFIIGIFSGVLGIAIAYLLTIPTNMIIENLSGLANVAKLNPVHALILIIISMALTIIGGAIPANIASRKDPVEALRTE
ncbi:aBC transporter [Firmicutes bacterium CAG:822]|nr:aBC transporter [Firmicutes bacterium CAG:822]